MDWSKVEVTLTQTTLKSRTLLIVRHAQRLVPVLSEASSHYGAEVFEWLQALHSGLELLEEFVRSQSISRFQIDLVAEIARATSTVATNRVRVVGPSRFVEVMELAFAAVAFAADSARATSETKSIALAIKSLQMVEASQRVGEQELRYDLQGLPGLLPEGELWPIGEPEWFTVSVAEFQKNQPTWRLWSRTGV